MASRVFQKTIVEIRVVLVSNDGTRARVETVVDGKLDAVYATMSQQQAIGLAKVLADGDDAKAYCKPILGEVSEPAELLATSS